MATSNTTMIAMGINEVREGTAIAQGGIAHLAEGICEYWFTPLRWSYGSGDSEVSGVTNLGDMFKGRRNEKSEADSKFLPAMYIAVAENFGIEGEMTGADKVAFRRGFAIAAARNAGAPVEFTDSKVSRKGRDVKVRAVRVPAGVAFDLDKPDGSLTELGKEMVSRIKSNMELEGKDVPEESKLLARAKALKVDCVGGKHPVLGKVPSSTDIAGAMEVKAIEAGLMPVKINRDRAPAGDKFGASLEFVIKCLNDVDSDEAGFAASDALEAKLRETAELIAAYFAK